MPVTKLDSRTALIVVDLQKGCASIPCASSTETQAKSPEWIFPRLGETGTTQKIVDLLSTRNA